MFADALTERLALTARVSGNTAMAILMTITTMTMITIMAIIITIMQKMPLILMRRG